MDGLPNAFHITMNFTPAFNRASAGAVHKALGTTCDRT